MLAFTPSSSQHAFLPAVPSPLSPRSANIHGPTRPKTMNSQQGQEQEHTKPEFTFSSNDTPTQASKVPFSQRSIKRAPAPKQDELKERRRNAFLRKVQDGREDRRFESRGEDIMRLEFVRRRREYEDELARNAPSPSAEEEEEESQLPGWGMLDVSSQPMPEEEVEEFVRDEEEEMRALLENLPDEEMEEGSGSENLWSDDADYDALFSEVLRSEEQGGGGEEMDMS